MKRLWLILFVIFIGCSSNIGWKTIEEESTFSNSTLGVGLVTSNRGLKVDRIIHQSNRFIVGDVLINLNGEEINNLYDYYNVMFKVKSGDIIDVSILRQNNQKVIKAKVTKRRGVDAFLFFINNILNDGDEVSLIIDVNLKHGDYVVTNEDKLTVINRSSMFLISLFGENDQFSILDRAEFESHMKELSLQQSGLTENQKGIKAGQLIGASHLFQITLLGGISGDTNSSTKSRKLTDLKSMKVIYTDSAYRVYK